MFEIKNRSEVTVYVVFVLFLVCFLFFNSSRSFVLIKILRSHTFSYYPKETVLEAVLEGRFEHGDETSCLTAELCSPLRHVTLRAVTRTSHKCTDLRRNKTFSPALVKNIFMSFLFLLILELRLLQNKGEWLHVAAMRP